MFFDLNHKLISAESRWPESLGRFLYNAECVFLLFCIVTNK